MREQKSIFFAKLSVYPISSSFESARVEQGAVEAEILILVFTTPCSTLRKNILLPWEISLFLTPLQLSNAKKKVLDSISEHLGFCNKNGPDL